MATFVGRALPVLLLLAAGPAAAASDGKPLQVAAAADLAVAFQEVGAAFEKRSGDHVIFSFGSTGLLAKQLAEGAPFDLFAAANISFTDDAIRAGACRADGRAVYARGRLVLWWRADSAVAAPHALADLADKRFVKIAIANPVHAPYGRAAQQALDKVGIWPQVQPRLVFGENVQQTLQFARSGNAEVALVALSLAVVSGGKYLAVDESLHQPLDQAMVVCGQDPARLARARAFAAFVASPDGRAILRRYGFLLPGETQATAPSAPR
jgi:molybdate transport system substrate-binding protein